MYKIDRLVEKNIIQWGSNKNTYWKLILIFYSLHICLKMLQYWNICREWFCFFAITIIFSLSPLLCVIASHYHHSSLSSLLLLSSPLSQNGGREMVEGSGVRDNPEGNMVEGLRKEAIRGQVIILTWPPLLSFLHPSLILPTGWLLPFLFCPLPPFPPIGNVIF